MNSVKSNKLVDCLMRTGDLKRAEKFVDNIDQPMTRELLKAESSLADGDVEAAATIVRSVPPEGRNNPAVTLLYGKVMLAQNKQDAAQEALFNLRNIITVKTRDSKLFQVTGDLARFVGEAELANLAQQNVDQLTELNKEFAQKLAEVASTRDDKDIRLQLADLAFKTDRLDLAYRLYEGLMRYYPDDAEKMSELQLALMNPLPQLVSTGTAPTTPPETDNAGNGDHLKPQQRRNQQRHKLLPNLKSQRSLLNRQTPLPKLRPIQQLLPRRTQSPQNRPIHRQRLRKKLLSNICTCGDRF